MKRIIIEDVWKKFRIGYHTKVGTLARAISMFSGREQKEDLWALKGVSFDVRAGEIIGLIGENGSGKSTLMRTIAGIYPQTKGNIITHGKVLPLINLYIGIKNRLTMRDNIYLVGGLFGLSAKEISKRFDTIVSYTELEKFISTKLYQFSTGMLQRLALSVAVHCDPEILLMDEVFAVGDEGFRQKTTETIMALLKQGASVVLVSHELWMIEKFCQRVIWLDKGKIVRGGKAAEVIQEYKTAETQRVTVCGSA